MGFIGWLKGEEPGLFDQLQHALQGSGHFGEYLTEYALQHGDLGNVEVFSNVLVPRTTGPIATTEIDVLMLHEKGIFVFESKNYSGWVFGSADQLKWTVSLNSRTKERFYNPIKQNRTHVKALASYLNISTDAFMSFIVFSNRCRLKKVPPDTSEYIICQRDFLLKAMRWNLEQRSPVFDEAKLSELSLKLNGLNDRSTPAARDEHIRETQQVTAGNLCPWCGANLVVKTGKYGQFMGCSRYPQCRFTRKL